jgi:epoxyqueuosine reductase
MDYHAVLRRKLRELKVALELEIGRPLISKSFADNVHLNERALAERHGLGFAGRHTLIIGPKLMGSFNFIGELFTDLELEPDEEYNGTCGKCFRCGEQCPTQAIVPNKGVDANLCISYLTIENKGEIPVELRPQLGKWVFGCDICQQVCPYNQRPPETPWAELKPQAGVGHYLDLLALLEIKDDAQFFNHFQHTALRRPKRRGLLRNALVVLGNSLRNDRLMSRESITSVLQKNGEGHWQAEPARATQVLDLLSGFIKNEPDAMLQEHATWAMAQYNLNGQLA